MRKLVSQGAALRPQVQKVPRWGRAGSEGRRPLGAKGRGWRRRLWPADAAGYVEGLRRLAQGGWWAVFPKGPAAVGRRGAYGPVLSHGPRVASLRSRGKGCGRRLQKKLGASLYKTKQPPLRAMEKRPPLVAGATTLPPAPLGALWVLSIVSHKALWEGESVLFCRLWRHYKTYCRASGNPQPSEPLYRPLFVVAAPSSPAGGGTINMGHALCAQRACLRTKKLPMEGAYL